MLQASSIPAPRRSRAVVPPLPGRSDSPRRTRPVQVPQRACGHAQHSTRRGSPHGARHHACNATSTSGHSSKKCPGRATGTRGRGAGHLGEGFGLSGDASMHVRRRRFRARLDLGRGTCTVGRHHFAVQAAVNRSRWEWLPAGFLPSTWPCMRGAISFQRTAYNGSPGTPEATGVHRDLSCLARRVEYARPGSVVIPTPDESCVVKMLGEST